MLLIFPFICFDEHCGIKCFIFGINGNITYDFQQLYDNSLNILPNQLNCTFLLLIQEDEHVNKPGPKRQMPLFAEWFLKDSGLDCYRVTWQTTWINLLYHVFKEVLIIWPAKVQIQKHMPKSFSRYPRTRVIVDCTECFLEKSTQP